uniref:t-SNARE coiled-coil homology domain-containing protein n=1 Tax=Kalanchoe fedtschenkoi TaxID=63787 RepID=A0A7N0T619_KALFE
MFGFMKSPGNKGSSKPSPVDFDSRGSSGYNPFDSYSASGSKYNPFDSDSESDTETSKRQTSMTGSQTPFEPAQTHLTGRRTPSEPVQAPVIGMRIPSELVPSAPVFATPDANRNVSRGSDDVEDRSVQELENHAVHKAEETTSVVKKCLKIAEDIRGDAVRTLEMLHHQGQQITRTHHVAVDIDRDLSRGEKLLGSLGSMFSRTWKPKKGRDITGPLTAADDILRSDQHKEPRENLGLVSVPKIRPASRTPTPDSADSFQKVQLEKDRQDDALSDLSNILGDLKDMALEMGSEIERQNRAIDHFSSDVDELNFRVKGANQRTRRLLGK